MDVINRKILKSSYRKKTHKAFSILHYVLNRTNVRVFDFRLQNHKPKKLYQISTILYTLRTLLLLRSLC